MYYIDIYSNLEAYDEEAFGRNPSGGCATITVTDRKDLNILAEKAIDNGAVCVIGKLNDSKRTSNAIFTDNDDILAEENVVKFAELYGQMRCDEIDLLDFANAMDVEEEELKDFLKRHDLLRKKQKKHKEKDA